MPTPNLTLTGGSFQTFEGQPLANGYLIMELSHDENYSAGPYQIVAGLKLRIPLDSSGNINPSVKVWATDVLTPSGAYYVVRAFESDGTLAWENFQYWQLPSSPSTLDVGTLIPNNAPGFTPPSFNNRLGSINYVIDGGGSVPSTGAKGQISIPSNCVITGWVLTADQSGSAVVDVLRSTYAAFPTTASIASTDKPTLASAQKSENLSLSVWTTSLSQGDQVQFNLNSVTTCTRLNITLNLIIQ